MLDKFALRHLMLHLLATKASNPKMMPLKQLDNLLVCLAIKMSTLMKPPNYVQRLHLVLEQSIPCLHFRNVFLASIQALPV